MCQNCSTKQRQIAKNDPKRERVCDLCDTALDNVRLRYSISKQMKLQEQKNMILQQYIERLEQRNNDLKKSTAHDKIKFPKDI